MLKKEILEFNKNSWNTIIKNGGKFSNTSLPEYGPFMNNEDNYQIFKNVKNKKVLELGCGKGNSLKYLFEKGASELWGVDISKNQIDFAKKNLPEGKFFVSEMEENPGIPENYFDYCLALYSMGYSADINKTLELVYKYLKKGGRFVFCWSHPFFNCLGIKEGKVFIKKSYNDESLEKIYKGEDKIPTLQYNLKISTLINYIIKSGLTIEKIIEDDPIVDKNSRDYNSPYYDIKKINICSTTLIIIAHK